MFTNFLFAILLTGSILVGMVTLDQSTSIVTKMTRLLLRWTRRSKILTTHLLKGYLQYRRTINKLNLSADRI